MNRALTLVLAFAASFTLWGCYAPSVVSGGQQDTGVEIVDDTGTEDTDTGDTSDTGKTDTADTGEADTDTDADSDSDADSDTDSDTDTDTGDTGVGDTGDTGESDTDTDADSDSDTDADTDADSDTDSDTDADTDSDTDADTDSDTDTDSDSDADTDSDSDTDTDTDTDTDVEPECVTDADCPADACYTYYCDSGVCFAGAEVDEDGDGYGVDCGAASGRDCDDTDVTIHPGATEVAGDLIDNDCDDTVDNGLVVTVDSTVSSSAWSLCYAAGGDWSHWFGGASGCDSVAAGTSSTFATGLAASATNVQLNGVRSGGWLVEYGPVVHITGIALNGVALTIGATATSDCYPLSNGVGGYDLLCSL
ncbi:MAG: putative metal-binding motif-containing protein [Patescibacteria group bacterium]|jgi:hypothetical protein